MKEFAQGIPIVDGGRQSLSQEPALMPGSVVVEPVLPRNRNGSIAWTVLAQDTGKLTAYLESRVREVMTNNNLSDIPSQGVFRKIGNSTLVGNIGRFYPGGLEGLRINLGNQPLRKRNGYWEEPANIENEARLLMKELSLQDIPNATELKKLKKTPQLLAFYQKYPGGIRQLKFNLGIATQVRKPEGFLKNQEEIEQAIEDFMQEKGLETLPNSTELKKLGFGNVVNWMTQYPGGAFGLREKLGQPIGRRIRSEENVRMELEEFIANRGCFPLTQDFKSEGKIGLLTAIAKLGGLMVWREKLGYGANVQEALIEPDIANEQLEKLMGGGE